jgi:hypothetical protein
VTAGNGPTRRDVLRYGAAGAVSTVAAGGVAAGAAAVGAAAIGVAGWPAARPAVAAAPLDGVLDLYVNEGFAPMVDGSLVYLRGFGTAPTSVDDPEPSLTIAPHVFLADGTLVESRSFPPGAQQPPEGRPAPAAPDPTDPLLNLVRRAHWASFFPRRTIVAETGSRVRLRVHNGLAQDHALAVEGVASTGPIAPGAVAELAFDAPAAGSYVYSDPLRAPVERVLGLYGALVVVPQRDHWRVSPGGAEFERQWLWLCHDIDPEWSRQARAGQTIDPLRTPCQPRYFTLNDRSGFLSVGVSDDEHVNVTTHEETILSGSVRRTDVRDFSLAATADTVITGQLIRLVNAGVVVHQMHFHGNHVWTIRRDGVELSRSHATVDAEGHVNLQLWEDVVELDPLSRKEVMLPLKRPPDSLDEVWAARTCDWHYPMHCHAEPSQTAAGGLYPGGLVADWVLAAPTGAASTAEGATP